MISLTKERFSALEIVSSSEQEEEFWWVCDLDEVLANSYDDYIPHLNARFETNFTPEEVAVFGFVQNVPAWRSFGEELFVFMRSLRSNPEFVRKHKVVEGASEGTFALTKIGRLRSYITTRPESVYQATVDWLAENGFPEAPVICLPESLFLTPQEAAWKKEQIEKSGAHLVLEDNIWFAEGLSIQTIIIEGKHNKGVVPKGSHIIKVPHWRHVPEKAVLLKKEFLLKQGSP